MSKRIIHRVLASAMLLASPISILPLAASDVPDAIAARGASLVATVQAAGAQIYECKPDASGTLAWQFREPVATLFVDGKTVGKHFAGPQWEMNDGSAVGAKVSARAPAASGNDIPLLKLEVTSWRGSGQLAGVTTVQRLNTQGGVVEGPCDTAGTLLSAPYSADYTFLRNGPATASISAPVVSRAVPAAAPAYVASPVFVAPRPAIGVIIVRGDDRDRRPRKKNGEPKSPTGEPKSPPSKPTPPTAEPTTPPAQTPDKVVRDHRGSGSRGGTTVTPTRYPYDGAKTASSKGPSEKRAPKIRDHRGVDAESRNGAFDKRKPDIRDHRAQPDVRDHRNSSKPKISAASGSGGSCGTAGNPRCQPQ